MGRKDIITKEYMSNPVVFADAFNQYGYEFKVCVSGKKGDGEYVYSD